MKNKLKAVSKRYLIYSGVLLLGLVVIPIIIKNNKTIKEERGQADSGDKMQCNALTSANQRCKRLSLPGKEFCWQHQKLIS
ncbi:MAG: hypothetical protein WAM24_23025 [Ignavibacteriaceae bacterium]